MRTSQQKGKPYAAHTYAKSHLVQKLLNLFQSVRLFAFPPTPPSTPPPPTLPPHHMQTPESCAKLPITTAPPAAMLIHYDGFILAIFSICPLAFFFYTGNRWRQFFSGEFFFHPYLLMAALDSRSRVQRKRDDIYSHSRNIQNLFFLLQ